MWNLMAGVIVIIIILLAVIFGYIRAVHEYKKVTGKYNPRDFENFMSGRPSLYDRPELNSENRRRNVSASDRETASLQRESSVKSVTLPTYEDLQPPPYDVAVHL
ncbi:uncharacterized protein LOC129981911 isoform X2 [Argiope bruennichi]|uniref:uncharacterized protein LOC129981911 isoform X2 n=1 Tax=Argiope bruennichi TaxID=94029 RepID=UPI0024944A84|nr:uncharacterized protein LOC129981911 isoform X2 [Argiope bruennichi]